MNGETARFVTPRCSMSSRVLSASKGPLITKHAPPTTSERISIENPEIVVNGIAELRQSPKGRVDSVSEETAASRAVADRGTSTRVPSTSIWIARVDQIPKSNDL
jgi:hypothetical protein